jgi:hypothetical protein
MKSHFSNRKYAFFSLFCFISGAIMPVAEPIFGSSPAGRTGRPLIPSEISAYGEYWNIGNIGENIGILGTATYSLLDRTPSQRLIIYH